MRKRVIPSRNAYIAAALVITAVLLLITLFPRLQRETQTALVIPGSPYSERCGENYFYDIATQTCTGCSEVPIPGDPGMTQVVCTIGPRPSQLKCGPTVNACSTFQEIVDRNLEDPGWVRNTFDCTEMDDCENYGAGCFNRGSACIPRAICCAAPTTRGIVTPVLPTCVDTGTQYTYTITAPGGTSTSYTNRYGYEICQDSVGVTPPQYYGTDPASRASCFQTCNSALGATSCAGWPGYSLPAAPPGLGTPPGPGPGIACADIDTYGNNLKAACDTSCTGAGSCQLRTSADLGFSPHTWDCDATGDNINESSRTEQVWLCPTQQWFSCANPYTPPCESDDSYCDTNSFGILAPGGGGGAGGGGAGGNAGGGLPPAMFCGDAICDTDGGENESTCSMDCTGNLCGNGTCDNALGETEENCTVDCSTPGSAPMIGSNSLSNSSGQSSMNLFSSFFSNIFSPGEQDTPSQPPGENVDNTQREPQPAATDTPVPTAVQSPGPIRAFISSVLSPLWNLIRNILTP